MTDQCLDAYLNDPYTKETQPLLQWIGQYRAIENNVAVPMTLLTIDNPPKKPEDYWRQTINRGALYLAIWGNRVMTAQYAPDAMNYGLATPETPQNQRMDVYKINPHWLSLCLDSAPNARYVTYHNPAVCDPPTYKGIAEKFTDYSSTCPPPSNTVPTCPMETYPCSTRGYCYDPAKNQMVSTYYLGQYDYCPEDDTNTRTNNMYNIDGTRVWVRQPGFDASQNAKCENRQARAGSLWSDAKDKLNSPNTMELGELQDDVTRLRTLQVQRGEETRQELSEVNEMMNAKNRYIELIKQENDDWDIMLHAIMVFFVVAAFSVIPVIGWMSGKMNFKSFIISIAILVVVYLAYLMYQIRQTGVKDFTDPQIKKTKGAFSNLDDYLNRQANIAEQSLSEYVNENCLCPTDETNAAPTNAIATKPDGTGSGNKRFYTPGGMIYVDSSAPHQMVNPPAKLTPEDQTYFTIEWQDAWNKADFTPGSIPLDKVKSILSNLGLPYDNSEDGLTSRGNQEISRIVTMSNQIQQPGNSYGIPLTIYVKLVLQYIFRDRRAISADDIVKYVRRFENGTYTMNETGVCKMISDIFESIQFSLTFGSTLQWYRYVCNNPFTVLPSNQTMTRRL